ncbi:ATP-binding protein [Odoribacter sp. OttesenSCG-928-L07]|nr:ATP-binding protein [Odoribacter sp. OttesenSCG-928-L07]MDL2239180.1 ATP-binding protein [Bacteroidales bacterium OttesenSCG-928-L14]MDL2240524.1 ATP-binding protein [Bacteroidales bacterium OttesenSCG-928-K22]
MLENNISLQKNEMKRNLFKQLISHLENKEFTIVTGARQTGKSTLLKQLEVHAKGLKYPAVFLNLENKSVLSYLNESPLNILSYLPTSEKRIIVLIDEIQYLHDPSNFLKLLYDEYVDKIKIVATGSSAFYIDDKFKDSLAGRKKIFNLLTCSFDEYLRLNNRDELITELIRIQSNPNAKSMHLDILRQEWETYMIYGGYPAVITESNKKEKIARLAEIRDSFTRRDVMESGVQNQTAFYNLFRILASQSGNLLNTNELSKSLRIKHETVSHYLETLQKCFHIALIRPYYRNISKELTKMPKSYLLDTGLLCCLTNNFQPLHLRSDKGMLWENSFFRVLCDKYGINEINFWRTTNENEVDFVIPNLDVPQAIEAKFNERLINENKYKKFKENYPDIPLSFAYYEPFDEDFFRRIYYIANGE